jgi:hypothetical protein
MMVHDQATAFRRAARGPAVNSAPVPAAAECAVPTAMQQAPRAADASAAEVIGDPREEYKSICEFLRAYSTLRFYQLALLLGTSGGIATALANPALKHFAYGSVLLRLTGLVVSVSLGVMEFRASGYWHHLRNRANELSVQLRYRSFPVSSRWNPLTTSGAGFYLHLFVVAGWIATLVLRRIAG